MLHGGDQKLQWQKKTVLANRPRNLISMDTKQAGKYTIQNELRFIKGIGNHVRDRSFYLDRSRLEILKSYKRSLDKREVRKDLDKGIILRFVEEEIKREELNRKS